MPDLSQEQSEFFDRAERLFGQGKFADAIEDARGDLTQRGNGKGGSVVKSGNPVIGFTVEKRSDGSTP